METKEPYFSPLPKSLVPVSWEPGLPRYRNGDEGASERYHRRWISYGVGVGDELDEVASVSTTVACVRSRSDSGLRTTFSNANRFRAETGGQLRIKTESSTRSSTRGRGERAVGQGRYTHGFSRRGPGTSCSGKCAGFGNGTLSEL